jgi:hypothetical protein
MQTYPGVADGSFVAPDHEYPAYLELRLTATDSSGLATTTSVRLDPQTVVLDFASDPPGLTLAVGSTSQVTPFSRTAITGSTVSLSAPSPQTLAGNTYRWTSWSDGGTGSHTVTASAAATYTARYDLDTTGPVISNVGVKTTANRATITWTTNVPADTQVLYGPTTTYGSSSPLDRTLTTTHSATLVNLGRRADYSFSVLSRDAAGNLSSANGTFRTK